MLKNYSDENHVMYRMISRSAYKSSAWFLASNIIRFTWTYKLWKDLMSIFLVIYLILLIYFHHFLVIYLTVIYLFAMLEFRQNTVVVLFGDALGKTACGFYEHFQWPLQQLHEIYVENNEKILFIFWNIVDWF